MRRRVTARSNLIMARGKNSTTLIKHQRSDGDFTVGKRLGRVPQRFVHRGLVIDKGTRERHEQETIGEVRPRPSVFSNAQVALASSDP